MATVKNVGAPISGNADLVYEDYTAIVKGADLTTTQVDDLINAGLVSYASKTYVDAQDGLNATQTYVDAGDATRVRTSTKDVAGGVPGLDAGGRVNINRIDLPTTQKYHQGPWSPASYPGATSLTTETTIFTCGVTDPGFPYKLQVFGVIDARTSLTAEYPVITVRDGSITGPIVARGVGLAYNYQTLGVDFFERTLTNAQGLGPDWSQHAAPGYSDATDGLMVCTGTDAEWQNTVTGPASKLALARRINPLDALTATDNQLIWMTLGFANGYDPAFGAEQSQNTIFGRVNSTGTQYVRIGVTAPGAGDNQLFVWYSTGTGDNSWAGTFIGPAISPGDSLGLRCGSPTDPLNFAALKKDTNGNVSTLLDFTDPSHNTIVGSSNRGWGFGMYTVGRGGGLSPRRPESVSEVRLDPSIVTLPTTPVRVIPLDLGAQTARTGPTTLYVRAARSGASATIDTSAFQPKLYTMAVPA